MVERALIDDALQKAERSEPAIRAAARLHIARVLTAFDKEEAIGVLQSAITEIEQLPLNAHDRHTMQNEKLMLTAAVAPDVVASLSPQTLAGSELRFISTMLITAMSMMLKLTC